MAKQKNTKPLIKQKVEATQTASVAAKLPEFPVHKNGIVWILLTAIVSFMLYANTFKYEYTFDDDICTLKNEYVLKGWGGLGEIVKYGSVYGFTVARSNSGTYRPFTLFTFATEQQLFGKLTPQNSHIIGVLLYALAMAVLCAFLLKAFRNYPIIIPILIALLFATHPLHTEGVANVKSRDEVLSMLFLAATLNSLWNYLDTKKISSLIFSLVYYFLATLSKENAVTFIAVIPLFIYVLRENDLKSALMQTLPFVGICLFYLFLRQIILEEPNSGVGLLVNNVVWGAKGMEKLSTELNIWLYYFKLMILPHPLSFDYSYSQFRVESWGNPTVWMCLLLHLALVAYGIYAVLKKQVTGLGILFYFITFSVVSNIIYPLACTAAERFLFTPLLGFCILMVMGVYMLLQKFKVPQTSLILGVIFGATCLVYSYLTIKRNPVWQNNFTLFESGTFTSPQSFRTHFNLAEMYRVKGETQKEEASLKKAIESYNRSLEIYNQEANTYYNLGVCYLGVKDTVNSAKSFQQALKLNPKFGQAANNLGVFAFLKKDYTTAKGYFEQAINGGTPDPLSALTNLGATYQNLNDPQNALKYYESALKYGKNNALLDNLRRVHYQLGNIEKSNEYAKALGVAPMNANVNANPPTKSSVQQQPKKP